MRAVPLVALALLPGCGADPRSAHGYALSVPAGWRSWSAPTAPLVPGEILEAHKTDTPSGPASLVVFRGPYRPETTAAQLLIETRYLLLNLPSLEIRAERELELAGQPAMLIEVTAAGTGRALSPTGTGKPVAPGGEAQVPTRRVWLRIPREAEQDTLEVFFHCPESEYERLRPAWEGVLGSLRLAADGRRLAPRRERRRRLPSPVRRKGIECRPCT